MSRTDLGDKIFMERKSISFAEDQWQSYGAKVLLLEIIVANG
jgi:hypothetical protein